MSTIYDWITVSLFAGLIVLYLQRSSTPEPSDSLYQYLIASVGCMVVDYLGNAGNDLAAILALAATLAYAVIVLKPFRRSAD
jgi:hypothetical protein